MEIHGEDITRPLLGEGPNENIWDSLLFMKYGFNEIDIGESQLGIRQIIARNNEKIQHSLKPFIPLYTFLRSALEETKEDSSSLSNNIIPCDEAIQVKDKDWTKKITEIQKYNQKNQHLRVLRDADPQELEKRLQVLRDICTFTGS
jgi:hypothetical protein